MIRALLLLCMVACASTPKTRHYHTGWAVDPDGAQREIYAAWTRRDGPVLAATAEAVLRAAPRLAIVEVLGTGQPCTSSVGPFALAGVVEVVRGEGVARLGAYGPDPAHRGVLRQLRTDPPAVLVAAYEPDAAGTVQIGETCDQLAAVPVDAWMTAFIVLPTREAARDYVSQLRD